MPNLTKRGCDAAKYTGENNARCVLWDTDLRGFGLRIFPSGKKSFVVSYRPAGQRNKRMMTVGAFGVLTIDQARKKARGLMVGVADGRDPLQERQSVVVTTFGEMADLWIDDHAKLHRKRWKEEQRRINKYIRPKLGSRPLAKITAAEVRSLHASIGKKTPTEANRNLELVRAVFAKAVEWEVIQIPNPASKVKRFEEKSRERWLTARELTRLAASIGREDDVYAAAAIRLILLTGSRRTELLRARWDRLDLAGKRLLLEDTKTGDPKVVALSAPAIAILDSLPRHLTSPWIFPSPKDAKQPLAGLKKPWERIRKRAKLAGVRIHDLRRTTGSWLVQAGVPLKTIGIALGHRDTRATEIYTRIAAEQPAEALELLGQAMSGLMRKPKRVASAAGK